MSKSDTTLSILTMNTRTPGSMESPHGKWTLGSLSIYKNKTNHSQFSIFHSFVHWYCNFFYKNFKWNPFSFNRCAFKCIFYRLAVETAPVVDTHMHTNPILIQRARCTQNVINTCSALEAEPFPMLCEQNDVVRFLNYSLPDTLFVRCSDAQL